MNESILILEIIPDQGTVHRYLLKWNFPVNYVTANSPKLGAFSINLVKQYRFTSTWYKAMCLFICVFIHRLYCSNEQYCLLYNKHVKYAPVKLPCNVAQKMLSVDGPARYEVSRLGIVSGNVTSRDNSHTL